MQLGAGSPVTTSVLSRIGMPDSEHSEPTFQYKQRQRRDANGECHLGTQLIWHQRVVGNQNDRADSQSCLPLRTSSRPAIPRPTRATLVGSGTVET